MHGGGLDGDLMHLLPYIRLHLVISKASTFDYMKVYARFVPSNVSYRLLGTEFYALLLVSLA